MKRAETAPPGLQKTRGFSVLAPSYKLPTPAAAGIAALMATTFACGTALAAGFEVGDNTTRSVARGGTGVALKSDPSALYFNPALLTRVPGAQLTLNSNFSRLNLEFQRAALTEGGQTTQFAPVTNDDGFFPAPFLAGSYQLIPNTLTLAVGLFGPSSYGQRCFGERVDGECNYDELNAARHMTVSSSLIEAYGTIGAAYQVDVGPGQLSVGLAGILGYQNLEFDVVVYANTSVGDRTETPEEEGLLQARSLTDWQPSGIIGLAYAVEGLRVGASYRLPFSWESEGRAILTPPPNFEAIGVDLDPDDLHFKTQQAGALRAGVGYVHQPTGTTVDQPRFDVAFDFVWEDWSRVDYFIIDPQGDVSIGGARNPINTVYQAKNYKDTFSFRLGGGYQATDWLKVNAGGFFETAAQDDAYTNVDFVSWQRFAASAGLSLRATEWLDIDLAYMRVMSPDRTVDNGAVYNPVVFSQCTGPDFDGPACDTPGTPPGNPQNNGDWSSSFDLASIGVTLRAK